MKNTTAHLVFPHQLFECTDVLDKADIVYLVEEHLFFNAYGFHKQKLVFHRASMKYYEDYLQKKNIRTVYISAQEINHDIRILIPELAQKGIQSITYYDVCDNWLEKRITAACSEHQITRDVHPTPSFLNTSEELATYFRNRTRYFQTEFYIRQRKRHNILMDENQKPTGGQWSFDSSNRLKYPKGKRPPEISLPPINPFYREAIDYVRLHYSDNYGKASSDNIIYPTTHEESRQWLDQFLKTRFQEFGVYEDAIVDHESILHHSVLTPMLNTGLLTPESIIDACISQAEQNAIPLNSLEGFVRQIIGWREFLRGVYLNKGSQQRTTNFWNLNKTIPKSFYEGTTGIEPIDTTIKRVLDTGYCHHIERLMVLGNFMLLCEFHPDEVYKWFMEMFIDAYDWVMVPNVYGMSQFADGGIMATKPYISGSSYILKMSNYRRGEWCEVWDALFWNFMHKHRAFFSSNPRLGMLLKTYDKMSDQKKVQMDTIRRNFIL